MSTLLSTSLPNKKVIRPTITFKPCIWGDRFLNYTPESEEIRSHKVRQIEELKEEVRKELIATADQPSQQVKLIDAIQRLGVGYHFEKEIDQALQHVYEKYDHKFYDTTADEHLFNVAIWFRLLRQQGYHVSSDIFNEFKNGEGKFRESLIGDVWGILSLYEATHLRVHGEEVLEDALAFTTLHLESFAKTNASEATQVIRALRQPIHKDLPRLAARNYISIYQEENSHNKSLHKLAKLDYNLLQNMHKEELMEFNRWSIEYDFGKKLPFARRRVVGVYIWGLSAFFEPQYAIPRKILTKFISLLTNMDDIYDNYGTLEELELLTEAFIRWDIRYTDQLPECLKFWYQAVLDGFVEIEDELAKEPGRAYRVHYAKEVMKIYAKTYLMEAKWLKEKYTPTFEEYMDNSRISTGFFALFVFSYVVMGEVVTKESFEWLFNFPIILRSSSNICRLMDDLSSHKFEREREHIPSSVECYMNQHGVSEEYARDEIRKKIIYEWKDLNQECLLPLGAPMPLLARIINLTRAMDVLYKEIDQFTHNGEAMIDCVTSVLVDSIPI